MLRTETPKIMSTADPSKKMSKSSGEKHNISIFAEEKRLRKQISSAVTDSGDTDGDKMSAGISNLFQLLKAAGNQEGIDNHMATYDNGELRYGDLKKTVADTLVNLSESFISRKAEITKDKKAIKNQIKESSANIRARAQETIREVKDLCGLTNVKF